MCVRSGVTYRFAFAVARNIPSLLQSTPRKTITTFCNLRLVVNTLTLASRRALRDLHGRRPERAFARILETFTIKIAFE